MKKILIALAVLIGLTSYAVYTYATVTESITWIPGQTIKIVKVTWVGETSGVVPNTTISPLNGRVLRVETNPHVNGTIQPQDNYDIQIVEHNNASIDILGGQGANRDTANTETIIPYHANVTVYIYPRYSYGPIGFSLSGNANLNATGDVDIYVEVPK